jgi:hypothetical protein
MVVVVVVVGYTIREWNGANGMRFEARYIHAFTSCHLDDIQSIAACPDLVFLLQSSIVSSHKYTHTLSLKSRRLTCLSIVDECKLCSTFGGFPMIVEIHRACNQLIRAWSGQQERSQLWYADEVNGTVIVRYGSIAQRCTGWASYNRRWQSISKLADQWPRCPDSAHPSILQSNIV